MNRFPEDIKVYSFEDEAGHEHCVNFLDPEIDFIYYHYPIVNGDRHYCDVIFKYDDNTVIRYFNPKSVVQGKCELPQS